MGAYHMHHKRVYVFRILNRCSYYSFQVWLFLNLLGPGGGLLRVPRVTLRVTVKPDVLLMGTSQTSVGTLVFLLTVSVPQVPTCAIKLLSSFGTSRQELVEIFQNVSSVTSIIWRQVCEFLPGWATDSLLINYQGLLVRVKKLQRFLKTLTTS